MPSTRIDLLMKPRSNRAAAVVMEASPIREANHTLFILSTILGILIVYFLEYDGLKVFKPMGFHCGDPKLSYKYTGDSYSNGNLMYTAFLYPFFVIYLTEYLGWRNRKGSVWNSLKQSLIWYREYFSGNLILLTVICIIKSFVGEPRPHFFDTCRPKEAFNCTLGFISKFECTNKGVSNYALRDVSLSFPSGHAALTFYMFIFLAWYIQQRLRVQPLIIKWIQAFCFLIATYAGGSRITDHRHHWWDVLAGTILGIISAIVCIKTLCNSFKPSSLFLDDDRFVETESSFLTGDGKVKLLSDKNFPDESITRISSM